MHLSILPVYHMYASCLQNPEDGIRYSKVWSYKYEPPCVLGTELRSLDTSVPSLRAISSAPWLAFLNEMGQHIIQPEVSCTNLESSCSCNYSQGPLISTWRHSLHFLCCISEKSSFWIDGISRLRIVELKTPNQYCFVFFFQTRMFNCSHLQRSHPQMRSKPQLNS